MKLLVLLSIISYHIASPSTIPGCVCPRSLGGANAVDPSIPTRCNDITDMLLCLGDNSRFPIQVSQGCPTTPYETLGPVNSNEMSHNNDCVTVSCRWNYQSSKCESGGRCDYSSTVATTCFSTPCEQGPGGTCPGV